MVIYSNFEKVTYIVFVILFLVRSTKIMVTIMVTKWNSNAIITQASQKLIIYCIILKTIKNYSELWSSDKRSTGKEVNNRQCACIAV